MTAPPQKPQTFILFFVSSKEIKELVATMLPKCTNPVDGNTLRLAVVSASQIWSGVSRLRMRYSVEAGEQEWRGGLAFASRSQVWHTSSLKKPCPRALTHLGGVRFIAWRLRRPFLGKCRRGPRYFWECRAYMGYSLAPESTLNKALCHTCSFGGVCDKYRW